MSYSITSFIASLLPWFVALLMWLEIVVLPCQATETATLKFLCGSAVTVAFFSSLVGLRGGVGRLWAIAGLALGLSFGILLALNDLTAAGAFTVPAFAIGITLLQWR